MSIQDDMFTNFLKKHCTQIECMVLKHRIGLGGTDRKTLRTIASFSHRSKEGIRKIEQRALRTLRSLLTPEEIKDFFIDDSPYLKKRKKQGRSTSS